MNDNHIESMKLEKAYTFFMVPFSFGEGEWDAIHGRLGKWQPIKEDVYKEEDVLYPYIMDLFKQENAHGKSRLVIYEFNVEDKGASSQIFAERILGKKQIAVIAKNAAERKTPKTISFTLLDKKGFAPHLFISPTARIGFLVFSIEVLDSKTIDRQIDLNYALHKRNETDNYQCVCLNPDNQDKVPTPDEASLSTLIPNLWRENQKSTMKNTDYICWNMNDFVDCLLGTMGKPKEGQKRIQYSSKYRMHLFSFSSVQDIDNHIMKADIIPDLLRLSRCVNAKYLLPFDEMIAQGCMLQTYENIFFASSVEGASMIAVGREGNSAFIDNIHQKFNRQYLLVYLLVLIQRYTLQSIEQRITKFESTDKQSDEELWKLIKVICRIKTNCYFTDVSIYTHHSQFYHLCCNNLRIPETFEEISGKIELLKLTTDKNIQTALQAQAKEEKKAERRQHILNWIVGILTIAQVMQAAYELINAYYEEYALTWSIGIGIFCTIVLVILMRKDIYQFISGGK